MKFSKLTKKLLLSALSLGLAVVTLTTTTYAWYTSSTEASATGKGTTSGTTADSTLQISSNGGEATPQWAKTAKIAVNGTDLVPVAWQSDGSFKDSKGQTTITGYYKFNLWFRTTKTYNTEDEAQNTDITVYLKNLKINNTAKEALTKYDNLLAEADGTGTLSESTYAVDVVRALDMVIADGEGANGKGYELSDQLQYVEDKEFGITEGTSNAQTYYEGVMGNFSSMPTNTGTLNPVSITETGEITVTEDDTTQYVSIGSIEADETNDKYTVLKVTFYIYLNGADVYCFDACKGQTFEVSLEFTTVAKKNA